MSLLGSILKTTLTLAETPIAIIKDVATLGATLSDEGEPYTKRKLEELSDDYDEMKDNLTK